ncbi:MAG: hypothetical protein P1P64_08080 [Treponemataceae bacterium]
MKVKHCKICPCLAKIATLATDGELIQNNCDVLQQAKYQGCKTRHLEKILPLYTIKPICEETSEVFNDGTTKLIVNTKAFQKKQNQN